MASTFQTVQWLPMEESIGPKSTARTNSADAPSPTRTNFINFTEPSFVPIISSARNSVSYARNASMSYARNASVAFARRVSGAFALFMVYWQGGKSNYRRDSEALLLKDTIRATIKEHNSLNKNPAITKRKGTYGQVGMPQDGAIEVYMPPYDKVLLEKIAQLPDVMAVERPLPFHLPSDLDVE